MHQPLQKRVDVPALKEQLEKSIGEEAYGEYLDVVKAYVRAQLTKVELDQRVLELLGPKHVSTHNSIVRGLIANALCPSKPSNVPPPAPPQKISEVVELEGAEGSRGAGAAEGGGGGAQGAAGWGPGGGADNVGSKAARVDVPAVLAGILQRRPPEGARPPPAAPVGEDGSPGVWGAPGPDGPFGENRVIRPPVGLARPHPSSELEGARRAPPTGPAPWDPVVTSGGLQMAAAWRGPEGTLPGRATLKRRLEWMASEEWGLSKVAPEAVEIIDLATKEFIGEVLRKCVTVVQPKRPKRRAGGAGGAAVGAGAGAGAAAAAGAAVPAAAGAGGEAGAGAAGAAGEGAAAAAAGEGGGPAATAAANGSLPAPDGPTPAPAGDAGVGPSAAASGGGAQPTPSGGEGEPGGGVINCADLLLALDTGPRIIKQDHEYSMERIALRLW